ncbi:TA system antitoxin ParD family protein [Salinisphaera orenii]|nr:hypothetical protein [Salinisphaera halophila]
MAISRLTLFRLATVATLGWLATQKMRSSKRRAVRVAATLPSELVDTARANAASSNRSLAGQLDRWARIGQFYDVLNEVDYDRIQLALAGAMSPDDLKVAERTVYEAAFMQRMRDRTPQEDSFFADLERQQRSADYDMSKLGTR